MPESITLQSLQHMIKSRDHRPELKQAYFLKLVEEVGELSKVIRKETRLAPGGEIKGTVEEELYDVLYYVAALANVYGIDLEECVRLKEELNDLKYRRA